MTEQRMGIRFLLIAGALVSMSAAAAADVSSSFSTGRHRVDIRTVVPGPSVNDNIGNDVGWTGSNDGRITWATVAVAPGGTVFRSDQTPSFSHRIYAGASTSGGSSSIGVYAVGEGSSAGGLKTSGLAPDTAFAGVGLYGAGPLDSMFSVVVNRNANPLQITFGPGAALQTRSGIGGKENPIAAVRLLVYPDDAAADADLARTGNGSLFDGGVALSGVQGTMQISGAFATGDFLLQSNGAGKYTVRAKPALSKSVTVPSLANASVVLVGDPTVSTPVPGASGMGLAALALALAGAGWWAIRGRKSVTLA